MKICCLVSATYIDYLVRAEGPVCLSTLSTLCGYATDMTYMYRYHCPRIDCTDGDVRLIDENGSVSDVGRVEYCIGGAWGTVCNYLWTEFDAEVVCRQLELEPIAGI